MGRANQGALLSLAVVLAFFPLALPNPYFLSIMVVIGIHSLITLGLSLLMGYAGQISLGHAAFFGLGAYVSGVFTVKFGMEPWSAFGLGLLLSAAIAFLVGVPALKLKGHYLAMATLAFGEIFHVIFSEMVEYTGGPSGLAGIPTISLFGVLMDSDLKYYYFVWAFVLGALLISVNIIHSRVGRALRSIHGSEIAASAMGVNTARYKQQIFVLSAIYASAAGSLYAHFLTFISPSSFTVLFSIILVTMVVVGGMGSLWGALLGATILNGIPEYFRVLKDYDILAYGLMVILIMIFMPGGLMGGLIKLSARWR